MILNIISMRKDGWYTVRTVNVCLISFLLYDWPQNFNSTSRSNIDMNFIFSFGGLYDGWDSWSFHKSKVATDNRDGEHQLLTWEWLPLALSRHPVNGGRRTFIKLHNFSWSQEGQRKQSHFKWQVQ